MDLESSKAAPAKNTAPVLDRNSSDIIAESTVKVNPPLGKAKDKTTKPPLEKQPPNGKPLTILPPEPWPSPPRVPS